METTGARENETRNLEVLHNIKLCVNLLLCYSKKSENTKDRNSEQLAEKIREYAKSQQENKVAVAESRAKFRQFARRSFTARAKF